MLEARGLGRSDGGRWIVRDVSFALRPGERVALRGASGTGKTVVLRALAALDPLDEGTLTWHGSAVRGDAVPRYRAAAVYVPQRPVLFDGTVEDDLRRPFELRVHSERRYDRDRIAAWLRVLDRTLDLLERSAREISGGEAQLVALLRAVQLDPAVLLLDEPAASLDPRSASLLESLVDGWFSARPDERALVWVTHDEQQAHRVAGRAVWMRGGTLEAS